MTLDWKGLLFITALVSIIVAAGVNCLMLIVKREAKLHGKRLMATCSYGGPFLLLFGTLLRQYNHCVIRGHEIAKYTRTFGLIIVVLGVLYFLAAIAILSHAVATPSKKGEL